VRWLILLLLAQLCCVAVEVFCCQPWRSSQPAVLPTSWSGGDRCCRVSAGVARFQAALSEPLPLFVPGCLGQEFCHPATSCREKLSLWLLSGFWCRVRHCLHIDVVEFPLIVMSFLCNFSVAAPHRVESWGEMSRAHGSAQDICLCLQCLCLMMWSPLAISCRVQNLHLYLLVCRT